MKRLILFAHYDADNRIRPYIIHHLRALQELGGEIRFISNSPLSKQVLEAIQPLVQGVMLRENLGFDFGMWKDTLLQTDLQPYDQLVLTNSSIAGPFSPLRPLFDRMAREACDFWALTENLKPHPHLQSFFLVFNSKVFCSEAFTEFWKGILPFRDKTAAIMAYEIGLTSYLKDSGFTAKAMFPASCLSRSVLRDILLGRKPRTLRKLSKKNLSIYYPDLLIDAGMPYVKMEMLLRNPAGLRLEPIRRLVQSKGFDLNMLT